MDNTTASADEALAVLAPRDIRTAGEFVNDILRARYEPVFVVIDPVAWKFYATTDETTKAAFIAAVPFASYFYCGPLGTGMIQKWVYSTAVGVTPDDEFFHYYNRRSIIQVVNKFVRDDAPVFALVNQMSGAVTFGTPAEPEACSAALAAVSGAGWTVCFELTDKIINRQAFE